MEHDDDKAPNVVVPKNAEDREAIKAAIRENILFSSLDADELRVVIDAAEAKEYPAGTTIIQQG